jgi:hypothetical protein
LAELKSSIRQLFVSLMNNIPATLIAVSEQSCDGSGRRLLQSRLRIIGFDITLLASADTIVDVPESVSFMAADFQAIGDAVYTVLEDDSGFVPTMAITVTTPMTPPASAAAIILPPTRSPVTTASPTRQPTVVTPSPTKQPTTQQPTTQQLTTQPTFASTGVAEVGFSVCQTLSAARLAELKSSIQQLFFSLLDNVPATLIMVSEQSCDGSGRRLLQSGARIIGFEITVLDPAASAAAELEDLSLTAANFEAIGDAVFAVLESDAGFVSTITITVTTPLSPRAPAIIMPPTVATPSPTVAPTPEPTISWQSRFLFWIWPRANKRECRTIDQNISEHISCRRITHAAQRFANIRQHLKANDSTLISIHNI